MTSTRVRRVAHVVFVAFGIGATIAGGLAALRDLLRWSWPVTLGAVAVLVFYTWAVWRLGYDQGKAAR